MRRKPSRPPRDRQPPHGAPTPTPAAPVRWTRQRSLMGFIVAVCAVVIGALLAGRGGAFGPESTTFPAPREAAPVLVVSADFVGAERCASCHSAEYATWSRSTHGRAGGVPSRDIVLAAFDGTPIHFRDAVVTPRVLEGGRFVFIIQQDGNPPDTLSVDGVVGGGHMAGGGTQGFMSRWGDGTVRFIPFDYSRQAARWFCNTGSRLDHGWQPITTTMPLAACGDWPPTRVMGDVPRFANCQGCHGSRVEARFDSSTHRYATNFASLRIDCES